MRPRLQECGKSVTPSISHAAGVLQKVSHLVRQAAGVLQNSHTWCQTGIASTVRPQRGNVHHVRPDGVRHSGRGGELPDVCHARGEQREIFLKGGLEDFLKGVRSEGRVSVRNEGGVLCLKTCLKGVRSEGVGVKLGCQFCRAPVSLNILAKRRVVLILRGQFWSGGPRRQLGE